MEVLKSTLNECGLDPARLELEITETVLLEKNEENIAVLHELRKLGVSIVLDDFGIGYSSMRYLQMFPFDKIKIDRSFIQGMTTHSDSAAIVCAIAGLGRSLDIETTAEGVETAGAKPHSCAAPVASWRRDFCSAGLFRYPSSRSRVHSRCQARNKKPDQTTFLHNQFRLRRHGSLRHSFESKIPPCISVIRQFKRCQALRGVGGRELEIGGNRAKIRI